MDGNALREQGGRMLEYVAEHWETQRERRNAVPAVQPGYLKDLVPLDPPVYPEEWSEIFGDLEKVIMQGHAHWNHPLFFSFYPTACSYPAVVGDILAGGIAALGFSWQACPSMTELEQAVLDWLVRCAGLPEHFLNSHPGPGCGIIQNTAGESTMVAMLAARARKVKCLKGEGSAKDRTPLIAESYSDYTIPSLHDPTVFANFVAYTADQAHITVEKDALMCGVTLRKLKTTREGYEGGNFTLTAQTLEAAIHEDRARGLVPFFLAATIGYTSTCGKDNIKDLAEVCNREGIWTHVDAAYAGAYMICPELRESLGADGLELVDSFNFNAHKTLLTNFDCAPMWFKDGTEAEEYFKINSVYLKSTEGARDYRHLQLGFGRRFRSLKLWFVLRAFGVRGLQEYLRTLNARAEQFAQLVREDPDFELFVPRTLGLTCFRLANSTNEMNEALQEAIVKDGRLFIVPGKTDGVFYIRSVACSTNTSEDDVKFAFKVIKTLAQPIINAKD